MFWDSSALVPLLLPETRSRALVDLFAGDREVAIWWATPLECQSAIFRRHRERPLDSAQLNAARDRLRAIVDHADVVAPSDDVRRACEGAKVPESDLKKVVRELIEKGVSVAVVGDAAAPISRARARKQVAAATSASRSAATTTVRKTEAEEAKPAV